MTMRNGAKIIALTFV